MDNLPFFISTAHLVWYMPTLLALLLLDWAKLPGVVQGILTVSASLMLLFGTLLHGIKLFNAGTQGQIALGGGLLFMVIIVALGVYNNATKLS